MFGISATDLVIILVLAVLMFGPEKLPEYSRKAARLFVFFRDVANNAKTTLATELGPEYADLELRDLHPKAFIAKQLREEVALIEDAKRELLEAQDTLKSTATEVKSAANVNALKNAAADGSALDEPPADALALAGPVASPFDPEAT
ncbi:Sec-independent protein translocase subunit TatB [Tessaracoccus sp. MC1865]|uniref:sec-independent translocase n=1 Tax=Tessaracoccus sp. MC1865 TaxID=2760310 RepID=UPI00160233F7|nr:sec-independent translocase [Tessaracoccus sp. MC1865]MBB1482285.1 Sec-independent protein translocase subunit TatB [Tessaracoccus sp. MC1865]QTO38245.1 Sec-independent protein translocase subunit TatB [Tessaracoccus sp. MC1865]